VEGDQTLTELEFFNTADLSHKQLFDYDNRLTRNLLPLTLQKSALKYLASSITSKFV
jgi:hypothetical protein